MQHQRRPTRWASAASAALACSIALVAAAYVSAAADEADFYKGKSIELIISGGAGEAMDGNARIVARHLGNHIPGKPNIVPKNMPGAGHVRAANYIFNQAPKDGTTLGALIPSFVLAQLIEGGGTRYDSAKFNWIGSTDSSNLTAYVWHNTGIKTIQDTMHREVLMGGTGAGSTTILFPNMLNHTIGTKFKIVVGYKSAAEISLAIERGEIQGRAGNNLSSIRAANSEWLRDKKIVLLVQGGKKPDPEFKDVPLVRSLATSEENRRIVDFFEGSDAIGRPILTTPGVPPDRVAMLRRAFDGMILDPAFREDEKNFGLELHPTPGPALQAIVEELVSVPPDIVAKAKIAMSGK